MSVLKRVALPLSNAQGEVMTLRKYTRSILVALSACLLILGASPVRAQASLKVKKEQKQEQTEPPRLMSPEQVDGYLAGLDDDQVRKAFSTKLKKEAETYSQRLNRVSPLEQDPPAVSSFFAAQQAIYMLFDRLRSIISGAEAESRIPVEAWVKLAGGSGTGDVPVVLALLALIILSGLGLERLFLRCTEGFRSRLLTVAPQGRFEMPGLILSRLFLDALGIVVYIFATFIFYLLIDRVRSTGYLLPYSLITTYYLRIFVLAVRCITSPKSSRLRPVPLSDSTAEFVYRWIRTICICVSPSAALAFALNKAGAGHDLVLFIYSSAGPIITILLIAMIRQSRKDVARLIHPSEATEKSVSFMLRDRFAGLWPYVAGLYVLAIGGYWWVRMLTYADVSIGRMLLSIFLIPACIAIDRWVQILLSMLPMGREVIELSPSGLYDTLESEGEMDTTPFSYRGGASKTDVKVYRPIIHKVFRYILGVFFFLAVLELWGIDVNFEWVLARDVLSIIVTVVLGLIAWEMIKAWIDARMSEDFPLQSEKSDEGGPGGSRKGTLLLLLRKFTFAVILIIACFTILSSIGVNIGPLIAGAGVVGLAIGFGAQTLVRDILSGIFFLVDDAFRVGDYIESGTVKGTVEHISLRSLTLRHSRGQVVTVPFGTLKTLTNFNRDYIITKLDIRVRFDTDPEKIRKIIKKINKEMRQDEEANRVLLSDIKSAGVRDIDDSALIIRVKFKTIPGQQSVVRRSLYHKIREAFHEQSIEFAQRNVTVYLPPAPKPPADTEAISADAPLLRAAGAAAAVAGAKDRKEEDIKKTVPDEEAE